MAFETGTASSLEDLVGKIVAFLTTNTDLVTAGQEWQALRQHRDNILAFTSPLIDQSGSPTYRKMLHTFRYDARSINVDSSTNYQTMCAVVTGVSLGTSFLRWQMRSAAEIATVRLRASPDSGQVAQMIKGWRLQYSDDGSSWTTALTVTTPTAFTVGEWRDFAVGGSPGSHAYWQIIIDSTQSGSSANAIWASMLLLRADGSVANHFGSEVIFKATGTAGGDEIFTGLRSEYDTANGWYDLVLNGYSGYDAGEKSWFLQPGALPGFGSPLVKANPLVPLWDTSMPYWIAANGRSVRLAVKVSTSYEGMYLGLILPYATPGQYPYPLAVGGSLVPQQNARGPEWRYSYSNFRHAVFVGPGASATPSVEDRWSGLYVRDTGGAWLQFANRPDSGGSDGVLGIAQAFTSPFATSGSLRGVWPHCTNDQWTVGKRPFGECLGGGYAAMPCVLLQRSPTVDVYGELEGVFAISGQNNAPENTTAIAGVNAVVFGNASRTTEHEFWALTLNG